MSEPGDDIVEAHEADSHSFPPPPWALVTLLLAQFLVFPLILFAVSGVNAWREGPSLPGFFQFAVFLLTAFLALGITWLYLRPKKEGPTQHARPDFWLFLLVFIVAGSASVFNVFIGVFTARGPQVFFGLGFCYFLFLGSLVPLYFKMRPQFRA